MTSQIPKPPKPVPARALTDAEKLTQEIMAGLRQVPLSDDPPPLPLRRTRRGVIIAARSAVKIREPDAPPETVRMSDRPPPRPLESAGELIDTQVRPAFVVPREYNGSLEVDVDDVAQAPRRARWAIVLCALIVCTTAVLAVFASPLGDTPQARAFELKARRAASRVSREVGSLVHRYVK